MVRYAADRDDDDNLKWQPTMTLHFKSFGEWNIHHAITEFNMHL